jgi:formylglycine-generating enzyme required for sulfatase activity
VPAFFLSAAECSRAEFAQFLAELKQATAGIEDRQQRLNKVAARFPGVGLDAERLQSLLERDVSRDVDKTPMDNLTWYSAAAFAAWYGRTLPTPPEWALAAFGDGNKHEFPWGNGWSTDPQQRNPSNQQMADVDSGGLSWRQADGVRLHHLAGNVAEWLFAAPQDTTAAVAGGRYNDNSESSVREQAAGKELKVDKTDARRGFGFRTALRPRSFPGLDWPK